MGTKEEETFSKELVQALVAETRRRGLKVSAVCSYCGETFMKQDIEYVLNHTSECKGREDGQAGE